MKPSARRFLFGLIIIAGILLIFLLSYFLTRPTEVDYYGGAGDSLEKFVKAGEIDALTVSGSYSISFKKNDGSKTSYVVYIPSRALVSDDIKQWAQDARDAGNAELADKIAAINVRFNDPNKWAWVSSVLPILLYAVFFFTTVHEVTKIWT